MTYKVIADVETAYSPGSKPLYKPKVPVWRTWYKIVASLCLVAYLWSRRGSILLHGGQPCRPLIWQSALSPNATAQDLSHPIPRLLATNEDLFKDTLLTQPQSVKDAANVYRSRYGLPPPPVFDRWYDYARRMNVEIYDNYDTIHDMMLPFWSLEPLVIRQRLQRAIGNPDNFLIVLLIRDGRLARLEGGLPWQREALAGMLQDFVHFLPDLDLAFNAHDEPRVVVPHGHLAEMVANGRQALRTVAESLTLSNKFSKRPSDMTEVASIRETNESCFTELAHKHVAKISTLSCALSSPAVSTSGPSEGDDTSSFSRDTTLSFIANHTAYTDVCGLPSLEGSHAFFDRPNAFSITEKLVPIFSESKPSSFQDIVFPSMWHWYGKIFTNNTEDMHIKNKPVYNEHLDVDWSRKKDDLYWRGSTTGGYSKQGGWRRHHRQRAVKYLNGFSNITVLAPSKQTPGTWQPQKMNMRHLKPHINVTFSGVGQCAEADCLAQKEFFHITPYANLSDAFQHRYVLDMDGNAFSARFYGLMQSKSVVFKQSLFREWHDDWLREWVHYIPLSLNVRPEGRGWQTPDALTNAGRESEWAEVLRWFLDADEGAEERGEAGPGKIVADRKRDWSLRVLRREDMQAWMFRLLLEYARVVDDNRANLGYTV